MKLSRSLILAPALLAGMLFTAAPASADGLVTIFGGMNFAGEGANGRGVFGASVGFMSAGIFGMEAELAHSPDFFGSDNDLIDQSSVTTAMVNLLVGVPVGGTSGRGVRPYVTAGAGLIRTNVGSASDLFDDISNNDFGINVGAGVTGFVSDHVGVKGDARYFRSLQNDDDEALGVSLSDFDFWRVTGGVVFRF